MRSMRTLGLFFAIALAAPVALADAPEVPAEAHGHEHGGDAHGHEHGGDAHGHEHADEAHGGEHGDAHGGEHGGAGHLNFADFSYKDEHKDPPLILALINFALLLALLGWKAVPALKEYWAKKSNSIRDGLEEGARLRQEAEKKLEEYTQRIKDVDGEVDALINEIRAEAAAEKERILAEAKAQAEATKKVGCCYGHSVPESVGNGRRGLSSVVGGRCCVLLLAGAVGVARGGGCVGGGAVGVGVVWLGGGG